MGVAFIIKNKYSLARQLNSFSTQHIIVPLTLVNIKFYFKSYTRLFGFQSLQIIFIYFQ